MNKPKDISIFIKSRDGNIANVRCAENVSQDTLSMLAKVVDKVLKSEKIPCHNCQGNGCEVCNGMGYYHL